MAVPDHRHIPKQLYDSGDYDLTTHEGQGKYVDACVVALHQLDQRWGFLKKTGSGAQIHGHSEDGALYLSDTPGQSQHVDFIVGAGGPNPQPGWAVDVPRYSRTDWFPPSQHAPIEEPEPEPPHVCPPLVIPSYEDLGGDSFYRAMIGVPLAADYAQAGQTLNDGSAVWFARTTHSLMAAFVAAGNHPIDPSAIIRKHRNEWRDILRLPRL